MDNKEHKSDRPRKLKSSEVSEVLASIDNAEDLELSEIGAGKAYLLRDGRLLFVFEDGNGILYKSRDQVVKLLRHVEEMASSPAQDPLYKLLPQGDAFTRQIPRQLDILPRMLDVQPASLDKTEESLRLVDEFMWRHSRNILTPERFSPLVAYVGEVILQATNGKWQVHRNSNDNPSEPIIVDPKGRIYQPVAIVYQEARLGRRGSVQGAVNGVLRAHLLSGDPSNYG